MSVKHKLSGPNTVTN